MRRGYKQRSVNINRNSPIGELVGGAVVATGKTMRE